MSSTAIRAGRVGTAAGLLGLLAAAPLLSQGPPPSPVRYTEAREHPVRKTVRLPGSVESKTVSLVASEVAGLVQSLPAREGDTIRKGQVLAQLSTSALEIRLQAAEAQLREAESRMKLAELSLQRSKELFDSKVLSQQQLDTAQYEFNAWQGRVEQLGAEIAATRLDIERCSIRAPFAGTVVEERTEVGEWIDLGAPVTELLSLEDLEIRVDVPERYFSNLKPSAAARVTFESLPGLEVTGTVVAIIPRADPQARSFPVKVRIPHEGGRIGVGMLAQVSLSAGDSYRATVVPKDAVVTEGQEKVVYLLDTGDKVSRVPVQTGEGLGVWVVVEGPVKAGQKVVTRGNERLAPGQPVAAERLEYKLP
jgi:RND family efflux transporter MFP subunit